MSIETMTKLGTVTVGAGGSATISFLSIPQTYTDLVLKISARASESGAGGINCYWVINGGFDMTSRWLNGNGSAVSAAYRTDGFTIEVDGASQTASTFSNGQFYIPNYTSSNYKTYSLDNVVENNATATNMTLLAGLRSNSAAITSIEIVCGSGTFVQHTKATLYGIKAMRKSVGSSIKATGGAVSFDGTYVVHTFNSTGVFTPTAPVLVDYLVVAGGAGGGMGTNTGTYAGGGGGAGGLRCTVGSTGGGGTVESRLSLNPQSYVVTIGAGGTGATTASSKGVNGSDSSLSSITSTGGGGGGSYNTRPGSSGGSGGGAAYDAVGGAGTTNQGYAGGASVGVINGGGGGGGAGAAGSSTSDGVGANGGAGVTTNISGTSVTYAGGGGGSGFSAPTSAGGSGGGGSGGRYNSVTPNNGVTNTGGGGGAYYSTAGTAANGGSGVVIVRYRA